MRFHTIPEDVEAIQYTCSKDRWSNTIAVCHFAGMSFEKGECRHFDLLEDPDERYGLLIGVFCGWLAHLYPGDWLVRHADGSLEGMKDDLFRARFVHQLGVDRG